MKSDQWIILASVLAILLHLGVWVSGYYSCKRPVFISLINFGVAISFIIYWAVKQWQIVQHITEAREIIAIIFEITVSGFAIYSLAYLQWNGFLKTVQAIFFGMHLAALALFLTFMLTFKMDRLF